MNMKIMFLVCVSTIIAVSCALLKKNDNSQHGGSHSHASFQKGGQKKADEKPMGSDPDDAPKVPDQVPPRQPEPLPPVPKPDRPNPDPPKPVSQYDSKALDEQVRTAARREGKDPQKYRLLMRSDDAGNKVYRMLGMHVIVSALGEETFLPDEI